MAFILSCYQHSGIVWSLRGEGMQCPWDTARIGGLLVWEHPPGDMGARTYEDRKQDARDFLEEYNAVANGHVYWYAVEDEDDNDLGSCGGFVDCGKEGLREMFEEICACIPAGAEIEVTGDAAFLADHHEIKGKAAPSEVKT